MHNGFIDPAEYERLQQIIPIPCVDVVPTQTDSTGQITRIGLIWRDATNNKKGWCLVGGRLRHNESVAQGLTRHLTTTLGRHIRFTLPADPQPLYVAQYFPTQREVGQIDPRQHAVALTFVLPVTGDPTPDQTEALDFQWFPLTDLPSHNDFGFGQNHVLDACLTRLNLPFTHRL